jgi:L-alanine-DL-glutamate epimerase-like enolase superfamily enzyme
MFDAFMGWDLPYAIEMVKALEAVEPFWMGLR